MPIHFFEEEISYKLKNKTFLKSWIKNTIEEEGYKLNSLNFIFCSDEYLLRLNREYLNHDTYTDIITFDNSSDQTSIEGDVFISTERVKENAKKFDSNEYHELCRVLIHGVLHLTGHKDKSLKDKELIRKRENYYLKKIVS